MSSAKDIVPPALPGPPTPAHLSRDASASDVAAAFRRLRKLAQTIGAVSNKNDTVAILISACIDEGFDRANRIVGTLAKLGFNRQHVGYILNNGIGKSWSRGADHIYRNIV